jgi:maleylacetate reductase
MTYQGGDFIHQQRALRVIFQRGGLAQIAEEVDRLDLKRVVLITSPRHQRRLEALLGDRVVAVADRPEMHVPTSQVDEVVQRASTAGADGAVAVGGGSAIGLAKALALRTGGSIVAAPTTFSGSEVTRVWGITEHRLKTTGRDEIVAPRTVIYDPELVMTLPTEAAVPSAFNALAHAVEALYAPERTPVTDLLAVEGIRAITTALPGLTERDPDASSETLYGAWLCGLCLDNTTMSLHHKLCHVLGGTLGLPHAPTHTALLPHVVAFNSSAVPSTMQVLRNALGAADPAGFLFGLAKNSGATMQLACLGMNEGQVEQVADIVLASTLVNPRSVERPDLTGLLHLARVGAAPKSGPAAAATWP